MNTHSYFQQLTSLEVEVSQKHHFQSMEIVRKNIGKKPKRRKSTLAFFNN